MKTIRTKIIMGILLCSLLTAAVIGTLAMVNSSQMASRDSKERARTEGELYAERINGVISQIEQSVNTIILIMMRLSRSKRMLMSTPRRLRMRQ